MHSNVFELILALNSHAPSALSTLVLPRAKAEQCAHELGRLTSEVALLRVQNRALELELQEARALLKSRSPRLA